MNQAVGNELSLAYSAFTAENYALARKLFEKAIDTGTTQCALNLGWLYESGLGGAKDSIRAIAMYELAMSSQPDLANYYLGRISVTVGQASKALQYLEQAARLGNPSAAYWAYTMHVDAGRLVEAEKLLKMASELGHVYAQRDQARKSLANASSIWDWIIKLFGYCRIKVRGVLLVLKDVNDPRIT